MSAIPQNDMDKAAFRDGLRDTAPTLFGMGAWAVVVGIAMVKTGLTVPQALAMSVLVYAGSAQLAALPLMAAGAPIWVIFLTATVVNLRFVIFSALLAPHFAHLPKLQRSLLGFVSGDLTVAFFQQRYPSEEPAPGKLGYLKGLVYPSWLGWQAGAILGIFVGSAIPASWELGFAGTLAIICIMVPLTLNRAAAAGVGVACVVSLAAHDMPYKLGLLAAVVAGMVCAMAVEETLQKVKR